MVRVTALRWDADLGWDRAPGDLGADAALVLVFGAPRPGDAVLGAVGDLVAAFPQAVLTGCSTAGEIHDDLVADGGLSVTVVHLDHARVAAVGAAVTGPDNSERAGTALARQLRERLPTLTGMLVLSEGVAVNGSRLVDGLVAGAGTGVTVCGGLAGDDDRFERTWVLADGELRSGWVVAVGFDDGVDLGHGCGGGWDIFGHERRITRAVGNVLHEIDDRPALDLYRDYLGDRAQGLPGAALRFPLSVRAGTHDTPVVRTILGIDEAERTLTFAGDLPEGGLAQLMRPNHERLVAGAHRAAADAAAGLDGACDGDVLAVAVTCVGRRLVLGERTEDELEAVRQALPVGTVLTGFYSYGEISPVAGGPSRLHNQTMTVATIRER